jgi:hypothetical protein
MNKAAEFRHQAQHCRLQAETVTNGISKEQWLQIAEQWEGLAQHAEQFPDAFL